MRVRLDSLRAHDSELYTRLYGDPQSMRWIGPPLSQPALERSFRAALRAREGRLLLGIRARVGAAALGLCGTGSRCGDPDAIELGIMLLPEACGRGLGQAALGLLIPWLEEAHPRVRLRLEYAPGHAAMQALAARLNFVLQAQVAGSGGVPARCVAVLESDGI